MEKSVSLGLHAPTHLLCAGCLGLALGHRHQTCVWRLHTGCTGCGLCGPPSVVSAMPGKQMLKGSAILIRRKLVGWWGGRGSSPRTRGRIPKGRGKEHGGDQLAGVQTWWRRGWVEGSLRHRVGRARPSLQAQNGRDGVSRGFPGGPAQGVAGRPGSLCRSLSRRGPLGAPAAAPRGWAGCCLSSSPMPTVPPVALQLRGFSNKRMNEHPGCGLCSEVQRGGHPSHPALRHCQPGPWFSHLSVTLTRYP